MQYRHYRQRVLDLLREVAIAFTDNRMRTRSVLLEGRDAKCCLQPDSNSRTRPRTSLWGHYAVDYYRAGCQNGSDRATLRQDSDEAYAERNWCKDSREYGFLLGKLPRGLGCAKRKTKWDISDSHPFRTQRIVPGYKDLTTTYMELGSYSKSARASVYHKYHERFHTVHPVRSLIIDILFFE